MEQNLKNNAKGPNSPMRQLAAEKKKLIIASCLIVLMVFMWVRVLGGKKPQTAEAVPMAQKAVKGQSNSQLKASFIELPKVAGRNDVLTRDFFAVSSWRDFLGDGKGGRSGASEQVNIVSEDGLKEVIRRVAEKLKLEAIESGENPRVFINGKLLSVGDKLLVRDVVDTYECEVTGIKETEVFVRCKEAEITLELKQVLVTDNDY